MYRPLAALALFAASVAAQSNADTSLTLLFQNNLNATDDVNHVGAILLDSTDYSTGVARCAALNEQPLSWNTLLSHRSDFQGQFNYLAYAGRSSPLQAYWINNAVVVATEGAPVFVQEPRVLFTGQRLPFLCTQSAQEDQPGNSVASTQNEVSVPAAGNEYTGYRNQKSFRFLGIRYAPQPERFTYSTPYDTTGQNLTATNYGSECLQDGAGSEDCLFLNIQTPYLPKAGTKTKLRPVLFWIHGGGFTSGSGADPSTDGGNLASREDVVVVTINYRLSTLGFFAVPGTDVKGNFGIGDQINALTWVVDNIASFGGDPNQITLNGESAGAGSVRTLLGSPPAIGKFQGAISMSNLGGGVALGLDGNYGTTYSSYYTINQSFANAGEQIFTEAGCDQTTLAAQIACLRAYPGDLTAFTTVARYVVQDGTIVTTPKLELTSRNSNTAYVPVIFGGTANDGASFVGYNHTCTTEVSCIASNVGITTAMAQSVIDSGLFPYYDTGNVTADSFNVSQRVTEDTTFRCVDQATVYAGSTSGAFPSAWFYQMERTGAGYNPNNVDDTGPVVPGYPLGDPNLPYYRVHGSDLPWGFGTLDTYRDAADLYSTQVSSGYFAAFIRTGNPNPSETYLAARGTGYERFLQVVQQTGPWNMIGGDTGPIRLMDYPPKANEFEDLQQCAFLGYAIDYYLKGGK